MVEVLEQFAPVASRIKILPDLLVNKIAAGEVIERPASVVKELIENSLDAGAGRIALIVDDGGRQLIRVVDNGCGMNEEELRLCVLPHATSKLLSDEDLGAIRTMGFRGEALASIAAVSHLRIASRMVGAIEGREVRMSGDQFEACGATGCAVGTSIEVRDLFFNMPARRKFLRGGSTEVGHINEQFARLALSHPQVGMELTVNSRTTQNLPSGQSRLERISRFYGPELAAALMHISRSERGLTIDAYAAPPVHSRATPQWQYIFVNGRFIRDRHIAHAVKESYRGLMEPSRHAVVFLFLEIDPEQVDVNVHPTKVEVRWADSNLVYSQVLSALRETFQRADLVTPLRFRPRGDSIDSVEEERMRAELAAVLKEAGPTPNSGAFSPSTDSRFATDRASQSDPSALPASMADAERLWRSFYASPAAPQVEAYSDLSRASGAPIDPSATQVDRFDSHIANLIPPRAIQMHNLYLVAESDDGIVIIDQHALHERVMYEQFRERFTNGTLESQRMLLPETMRLTPEQSALLDANAELLRKLGIELTPFGADSVAIHSFPALMKDADVQEFMRDLFDRLAQSAGETQTEVVVHRVLDLMACKAAVKAGDSLTQEEIQSLMAKRHLIEKSTSCPHGRPTILRLTKTDLNRQFKRT
ncbi:MAG: DNA mismatch repair endonuclease MutL [Planctomycetes bacterium]|nr:DNA mismatch repair endonuclease MutL [Planctomycetota bacterium]MBI3834733.1 DNA mismatch repair endonuclease MutL [Planctomycetota bacterium]